VHFMDAIEGFPEAKTRSVRRRGLRHTGWQFDGSTCGSRNGTFLEFSRDAKHVSPGFSRGLLAEGRLCRRMTLRGKRACNAFQHDLQEMIKLVKKARKIDLCAAIPPWRRPDDSCARRCCWPITMLIIWASWVDLPGGAPRAAWPES